MALHACAPDRGVLAAAPYGDVWMGPLHGVTGVLGAYLVSPTSRNPLLLEPLPQLQPPPPGGKGSGGGGCVVDARLVAGPSGGAVWEAAMTHAAMLFSPRPPSPSPGMSREEHRTSSPKEARFTPFPREYAVLRGPIAVFKYRGPHVDRLPKGHSI